MYTLEPSLPTKYSFKNLTVDTQHPIAVENVYSNTYYKQLSLVVEHKR